RTGRLGATATMLAIAVVAAPSQAALRADDARIPGWQAAIERSMTTAANAPAARIAYHVLAGEMALSRDNMSEAAEQYAAALALNARVDQPVDAPTDLAERTAKVAITADRPDLAYPAVKLWAARQADDIAAQQAALELAFVNDDADGVIEFAPRFARAVGPGTAKTRQAYQRIADLLSGKPAKSAAAIALAKQIQAAADDKTAAGYALALVAFGYDELATARQAITPVIAAAPEWADAHLLAAFIEARDLHVARARDTLAALSGSADEKATYHARLARYLLSIGKNTAGLSEFETAVSLAPSDSDARFGLALARLGNEEPDKARMAFEALTDDAAHGDAASYYLGRIAEQQGAADAARQRYEQVGAGDYLFQARLRLAVVQAGSGELDAALNTLDALAEQTPSKADDLLSAKAELLTNAGQADRALSLYNEALAHRPGKPDLLYGRALAHESMGDIDAARADLDQILKIEPDNAMALNALGYLLTNHSSDYARAEKLIRRALKQQPEDASMLDSLGWVEYKQGDLAAARRHLERAYESAGHPEIARHLGEVRWAQGDHEAARQIWQEALAAHPDDADLKQTLKTHRS
ncbi:tetratricopeptide repeat protein, partial [Salinisphaera japonica]